MMLIVSKPTTLKLWDIIKELEGTKKAIAKQWENKSFNSNIMELLDVPLFGLGTSIMR